jgi:hypothetical protein
MPADTGCGDSTATTAVIDTAAVVDSTTSIAATVDAATSVAATSASNIVNKLEHDFHSERD